MHTTSTVLSIAHRGASGTYPENTLLSFRKAIELGAEWTELDVQLVHDELLVFHDRDLRRMAGISKLLSEVSLPTLRSLDVGLGERIPTLREVLDVCKGRMNINVELKGFFDVEKLAEKIREILVDGWDTSTLLVSSFNHVVLKALKDRVPELSVAPILSGYPLYGVETAKALEATTVCLDRSLINAERVAEYAREGIRVLVFTVDEPNEIQEVISFGVHGVMSNYPDRVTAART